MTLTSFDSIFSRVSVKFGHGKKFPPVVVQFVRFVLSELFSCTATPHIQALVGAMAPALPNGVIAYHICAATIRHCALEGTPSSNERSLRNLSPAYVRLGQ